MFTQKWTTRRPLMVVTTKCRVWGSRRGGIPSFLNNRDLWPQNLTATILVFHTFWHIYMP